MAKKTKGKKPTKKVNKPSSVLPQNIKLVGDCVGENRVVYISQVTYKTIQAFTRNKTTTESGGILLGTTIESFGKSNIIISAFIEARFCEATPTTLKFTHQTWEHIHKIKDSKYPNLKIVGWIHTHPNYGIFLSEYDKFIHQNFFSDENQIAMVVDPIQKTEGFFCRNGENLDKCAGYFLYGRTGESLDAVSSSSEDKVSSSANTFRISFKDIIIFLLVFTCVLLVVLNKKQDAEITELQNKYDALVSNEESIHMVFLQQINKLQIEIEDLRQAQNADLSVQDDLKTDNNDSETPETNTVPETTTDPETEYQSSETP